MVFFAGFMAGMGVSVLIACLLFMVKVQTPLSVSDQKRSEL